MIRDTQRSKLYKAEEVLEGPHTKVFRDLQDITAFVEKVVKSKRFRGLSNWKRSVTLRVESGAGRRSAAFKDGHLDVVRLTLPVFARKDWIILHELSHYLVYVDEKLNGREAAIHGREFCNYYLKLVSYFLGREEADKLKESFRKNKVRYLPKRTLSPERRAKAIQQLAKLRLSKTLEELSTLHEESLTK